MGILKDIFTGIIFKIKDNDIESEIRFNKEKEDLEQSKQLLENLVSDFKDYETDKSKMWETIVKFRKYLNHPNNRLNLSKELKDFFLEKLDVLLNYNLADTSVVKESLDTLISEFIYYNKRFLTSREQTVENLAYLYILTNAKLDTEVPNKVKNKILKTYFKED